MWSNPVSVHLINDDIFEGTAVDELLYKVGAPEHCAGLVGRSGSALCGEVAHADVAGNVPAHRKGVSQS